MSDTRNRNQFTNKANPDYEKGIETTLEVGI